MSSVPSPASAPPGKRQLGRKYRPLVRQDARKPSFLATNQARVEFHLWAAEIHERAARFWRERGEPAKADAERAMVDIELRRAATERKLVRS